MTAQPMPNSIYKEKSMRPEVPPVLENIKLHVGDKIVELPVLTGTDGNKMVDI